MDSLAQTSRPRRIYLQTITLIHKNILLFTASWFPTFLRALLFPVAIAIIFAEFKHLGNPSAFTYNSINPNMGISNISYPIHDLASAITASPSKRLVFVLNNLDNDTLGPIIEGVLNQPGMKGLDTYSVNDPNDLFTLCKQSTTGYSTCFAAIIFQTINDTNIDYIIAFDQSAIMSSFGGYSFSMSWGDYRMDDTSLFTKRIAPLQWAIESQLGNFSTTIKKPSTAPFSGWFGPNVYKGFLPDDLTATKHADGSFWLSLVGGYVGPVFILITIGVVYHLATFVATEREIGMAELMAAQTVTTSPRIISTMVSFFALYFPGLLAASLILTQILFVKTSDILFLFITLLSGASAITSAHFVASLFGKAQLAGLTASTLTFALALITLVATLTSQNTKIQPLTLGLVFPPCTWAYFISDVATREYNLLGFSLKPIPIRSDGADIQRMNGYLYVIYSLIQIIFYTLATYGVEKGLWGVKRNFSKIEAGSDVALRVTGLTKTYEGKRPWYWPFMHKGKPVVAINDLNLEVKKGSVTFLLGPNGGGKTTTLKCVAGMVKMDRGSVLELNEAGLVFGICPQMNVYWETLTVEQHIKIWRKLKTAAFMDQQPDDDDVIVECDLVEKSKAKAKTLSGGQVRKLQLAMAFVGGSKVCCIDEASSGLDPLSRRNIWNIIQSGHARRTILITTHFLDEADVLADHIAIVYKGNLVCEGPGTALKARYGDAYVIRSEPDSNGETVIFPTYSSSEATKKILELESLASDQTFNVVFPTLEQVFLKVTSDSHTAINRQGGDGIVGEEDGISITEEKAFEIEVGNGTELDLETGQTVGLFKQVSALFLKRYMLLAQMSGWLSYGINLLIPIIVAAAVVKYVKTTAPMQTCAMNELILQNTSNSDGTNPYAPLEKIYNWNHLPTYYAGYNGAGDGIFYLGPESSFSGDTQDGIFNSTLDDYFFSGLQSDSNGNFVNSTAAQEAMQARMLYNDTSSIMSAISNSSGYGAFSGFGIYAPTNDDITLYYNTYSPQDFLERNAAALNYITNRLANSTAAPNTIARESRTRIRQMTHTTNDVAHIVLPITILVILAFIAACSIAVIYPTYEKVNRVRALHFCNGVEPFALWFAYLLFDIQIIVFQSIIVWAILFASHSSVWYAPNYLLGVFIFFGISTYLGTYILSLFLKKAAFAITAGIHVLLFVLYLVSYVLVDFIGARQTQHQAYTYIQYGLGLISPGANLARALWVSGNGFEVLCGKYGDADTSNPGAFVRYGNVYMNLLIQIIFLAIILGVYEYGSSDWWRRNVTQRRLPARLHYIVESEDPNTNPPMNEKVGNTTTATRASQEILKVNKLSKFFNQIFAVENVSLSIKSNQTLALLGSNGAGKTTIINMIRGELKPNFGSIYVNGLSVQENPRKTRVQMGVCPQDDAVDNLSVGQTLRFYARVKGLKDVEGNVGRVMERLNISGWEGTRVKDLSGGTKRKLSVAVALLGNPKLLLLDEPSTGQDAGAKRILWQALKSLSHNRAILLTTHSMEEAEALATDVAIIGGRMLAKGSLGELQERYGGEWGVRATVMPGVSIEEVERRVKEVFGEVRGYHERGGEVRFGLEGGAVEGRAKLGRWMRGCEELMGNLIGDGVGAVSGGGSGGGSGAGERVVERVFSEYTVTGPTLEEVFMNVARESGLREGAGVV